MAWIGTALHLPLLHTTTVTIIVRLTVHKSLNIPMFSSKTTRFLKTVNFLLQFDMLSMFPTLFDP